nr:aminotransferase class V-fold PLP-dependent enzyme [Pseudenhygromyxa sp. WMMC2535]
MGSRAPLWQLDAALDRLLTAEREDPVRATRSPEDLRAELGDLRPPAHGRPDHEVLAALERLIRLSPATCSPRFFNLLFAGRIPAAAAADMLAAFANHTMHTFKVAGPMVLVEAELLEHMLEIVGFAEGEGSFAPGGSLSNLLAMAIARNHAQPEALDHGCAGARARIYSSAEDHYSIAKNAGLLGIGRANVVPIEVDDRGRMRVDALHHAIAEDRARGYLPAMINATAGTTVRGEFDPIDALAELAAELDLWLHVDACLGGALLLSPDARHHLQGIERVDSLTWDAHKMMGVPVTCSALLLRDRGHLARNLDVAANYLFQADGALNPGRRSLQCGRRNDALKLWAAWQSLGDEGYAARVDRQLALTRHAAAHIQAAPDLDLYQPPASTNVCFTHRRATPQALTAALREQQRALVSHAQIGPTPVIRLACLDPDIDDTDIDTFFAELDTVAAALPT